MALFVLLGVFSPRRRLYETEAAGFPVAAYRRMLYRKPLCGLNHYKNCSFLNRILINTATP
jgi:hypothetical protein